MRKPRYYVQFAVLGVIDNGQAVGKSERRLYTYDDLEFMFRLANPFSADDWMIAVSMLRRRQSTLIKVNFKNAVQGIRITRY